MVCEGKVRLAFWAYYCKLLNRSETEELIHGESVRGDHLNI